MSTFVLVGDSQAVGLEAPLAALLEARGWRMIGSAAHVGWTTGRMVASGEAEALMHGLGPRGSGIADAAIVVLGGNDTASDTYPGKVRELVRQLRPARVIWIGPAHVDAQHPEIAARKARVAEQQRAAALVDGFTWYDGRTQTRDLEHAPDGLHFRPEALRTWAERIVEVVAPRRRWGLALAAGAVLGVGGVYLWSRT